MTKESEELFRMEKPEFKDTKSRSSVDLSKDLDKEIIDKAISTERTSVIVRYVLYIVGFVAGIILIILGVSGVIDIELKSVALSAKIVSASPGIGLVVLTLILAFATKPKIRVK